MIRLCSRHVLCAVWCIIISLVGIKVLMFLLCAKECSLLGDADQGVYQGEALTSFLVDIDEEHYLQQADEFPSPDYSITNSTNDEYSTGSVDNVKTRLHNVSSRSAASIKQENLTKHTAPHSVKANGKEYVLQDTACGYKYVPKDYFQQNATHFARHLPQAIHIGTRKVGSTAFIQFLNLHPNICAKHGSEVQFFMNDNRYRAGYDYYRSFFPPTLPEQISIEKSVYFMKNITADRIHKFNSSIRLLLQVRNPVDRAISDYFFCVRHGMFGNFPVELNKTFEEWAIDNTTGRVNSNFLPISLSDYAHTMSHWLKFFKRDQFFVIDGDQFLRENPAKELRKVETFLHLDNVISEHMFYMNTTTGFYCSKVSGCVSDSGHQHRDIDPQVVTKLRQYYRPTNKLFYKQLGIDFGW